MPQSRRSPPIINAPPLVTALALSLAVAHVIRLVGGQGLDGLFVDIGAVFPERFWGWAGVNVGSQAYPPYGNVLSALIPLVGTAFVHGSWSHLLMNAVMLVALGKPVYLVLQRVSRSAMGGSVAFLILFLVSVAGGSIVHLLAHYPVGPPAIGASGGVSGYLAAVLLLQNGPNLVSRKFLTVSAVFVVANAMLAFLGPSMFGAEIAWQAHIGGYITGAILFRYLLTRRPRAGI
ncbi:rhomboid family intramembrane serine protease [Hyphomonas pacifica]|uniref:rhomboid family intramembrane serine protease n=1 Tax=Hyphomonas pacifica TaxID=1280941 RepID=UPI000DBFD4B5|nr:rhomboid family intramembrane serine protease [Hyphomonas pacifica]RAN31811.1 hypothetical protein HY11_06375 [Hyphomonas pacifica]